MHAIDDNPLARRLGAFVALTGKELAAIDRLSRRRRSFLPGRNLVHQGRSGQATYVLLSGWAISYKIQSDGSRQIIDIHIPGDFLGLRSVLLHASDHSIEPLIDIETAEVMAIDLMEAFKTTPRLGMAVLWVASRETAMLVEHLVGLGRRNAVERMAHFLLELGARLQFVNQGNETGYACPLTQYQLADVLGLSAVHVNRILRQLREKGMVTFRDGYVSFDDREGLIQMAGFDTGYLNGVCPLLK